MVTYIALFSFTEKGIANCKDTVKRVEAFAKAAKKAGGSVREAFWTLGSVDGVLVLDAPDEKTAAALVLSVGRLGNVRTQMLRAFGKKEMAAILAKVT